MQQQLKEALELIDGALQTDGRDQATLRHARRLVQRVHDKNPGPGGYAAAITRTLSKRKGT